MLPHSKVCTGPAHPNAVLLPLTEEYWYFRKIDSGDNKAGTVKTPCRLCVSYQKYGPDGGVVDCKPIRPFVQELFRRYNNRRDLTAEAIGISPQAITNILYNGQCTIQRATAKKIILALDNKRREDRRNGCVAPAFIHAMRQAERIERLAGY